MPMVDCFGFAAIGTLGVGWDFRRAGAAAGLIVDSDRVDAGTVAA